ncbi:MAG: energy transducer TonB [Cyclobacteriaceae bacterium]
MELRKKPKLDLERKRGMFFNIGLALSLAVVLTAFEWRSHESELVVFEPIDEEFEFVIEIPPTVIPPPPPPPVQQVTIVEVPDIEEIEEIPDIEIDVEFDESNIIEVIEAEEPPIEEAEEYVDFASEMPSPMAGMREYYKFISKSIKYPDHARRMGLEGKVFVQFIINKEGEVTEIQTIKGIGGGCDEEAERVIALSPKWKPGKQGSKRVNVRMIMPIIFKLN